MSTLDKSPPPNLAAWECVRRLRDAGMSAEQIAQALDRRVSWRSVYRWGRQEHAPQQASDLEALRALVQRVDPE